MLAVILSPTPFSKRDPRYVAPALTKVKTSRPASATVRSCRRSSPSAPNACKSPFFPDESEVLRTLSIITFKGQGNATCMTAAMTTRTTPPANAQACGAIERRKRQKGRNKRSLLSPSPPSQTATRNKESSPANQTIPITPIAQPHSNELGLANSPPGEDVHDGDEEHC